MMSKVKATIDEGKSKITEVKVACQERMVKKIRARRENNSGRVRRDARLHKGSKEHGSGRSGRTKFRTECDQCSAKADISLRSSMQRQNCQLLADGRRRGIIHDQAMQEM